MPTFSHLDSDFSRCHVHELTDCVSCTRHAHIFDSFSDFIEHHHHGSFGPGTQTNGAYHGHAHQRVHVEDQAKEKAEPLENRLKACKHDGNGGTGHDRPLRKRVRKFDRFRNGRKDERDTQAQPGNGFALGLGCIRFAGGDDHRVKTRFLQFFENGKAVLGVRMKFHDAIDLVDSAVKSDKLKNLCDIGVRLHALDANCHFREDRFADFVCLHTHRVDDGDEHRGGDVLIGRRKEGGTSECVESNVLDKVTAFEGFFDQSGFGTATHLRNVELDTGRGRHGANKKVSLTSNIKNPVVATVSRIFRRRGNA